MRIRTIKPGFFTHEEIAELSPLARILFIGLWCMADVAGRLEDRPKRIKIEVLPYDKADADALLNEIQGRGFIERYAVDGVRIIQVKNFEKHQRISGKEAQTTSEYPEKQPGSTGEAPGCFTESQEGKGREGKGREEERKGKEVIASRRFAPPTEEEWVSYCTETWPEWHPISAGSAYAHYQGTGWRTKAGPIKDWKATARTAHGKAVEWGTLQPRIAALPPPTLDEWIDEGKRLNREARNGTPEWSWEACEAIWHDNQAKGWRFTQDWKAAILAAYNRFVGIERQFADRRR